MANSAAPIDAQRLAAAPATMPKRASEMHPQRRELLDSIQLLRAIAAGLVLLYHAVTIFAPAAGEAFAERHWIWRAIGFAGVDLFFVISGVVMTMNCFESLGRPEAVLPFLKRRFARIYPFYWVILNAVIVLRLVAPELAVRDMLDANSIVRSVLLWPQDHYPIVAVAWTLTFEVYFYAAFAALIVVPRRMFLLVLGMWAAAVLVAAAYYEQSVAPSLEGNLRVPLPASPLALEFIAGCLIGWLARRGHMRFAGQTLAMGSVLFVAGGAIASSLAPEQSLYGLARVALFGLASTLVVYGLVGREVTHGVQVPRVARFWGDASYSLYLTHVYVILVGAVVGRRFFASQSGWAWDALMLATLVASAAAGAACHLLLERPLTALARRALGVGKMAVPSAA